MPTSTGSFAIPMWWEPNLWEPTVMAVLPDFCKPGDVVFDIGTNLGGLAAAMSRLVGPKGVVAAFEASPRIAAVAHRNLLDNGCSNTFLMNRAVYSNSGSTVRISGSEGYYNDSIYAGGGEGSVHADVETISIDDFVRHTKLVPSFVKMDIEGAEYDALMGMVGTLRAHRPMLILEQTPQDTRCFEMLVDMGYAAVDLASYRRLASGSDFPAGTSVANVLFVDAKSDSAYLRCSRQLFAEIPRERIVALSDREIGLKDPVALPAGRYIFDAHLTAAKSDNEVYAGLNDASGKEVLRCHTNTAFLAESYTRWVVALRRPQPLRPYLRFLAGEDQTLEWNGVTIDSIPQLSEQGLTL